MWFQLMMCSVVETPEFIRRAAATGIAPDLRVDLVNRLALDPRAGVALGGGLWKLRLARPGAGRSGGWRVVYFYRRETMPVFLLTAFGKNEKANISRAEQAQLQQLCDLIEKTYGR